MSVRRWHLGPHSGLIPGPDGPYVLATDYEALAKVAEETAAFALRRDAVATALTQCQWRPIDTVPPEEEIHDSVMVRSKSGMVTIQPLRLIASMREAAAEDGEECWFAHWHPIPQFSATAVLRYRIGEAMSVKRFSMQAQRCMGEPWQDIEEEEDGMYVLATDYDAITARVAELEKDRLHALTNLRRVMALVHVDALAYPHLECAFNTLSGADGGSQS